jgi:hypothetical protein
MKGGSSGIGINSNFGDTATISNVCTNGSPSITDICCRYQVSCYLEPWKPVIIHTLSRALLKERSLLLLGGECTRQVNKRISVQMDVYLQWSFRRCLQIFCHGSEAVLVRLGCSPISTNI